MRWLGWTYAKHFSWVNNCMAMYFTAAMLRCPCVSYTHQMEYLRPLWETKR